MILFLDINGGPSLGNNWVKALVYTKLKRESGSYVQVFIPNGKEAVIPNLSSLQDKEEIYIVGRGYPALVITLFIQLFCYGLNVKFCKNFFHSVGDGIDVEEELRFLYGERAIEEIDV